MATVVYKNAALMVGGSSLAASLNELGVEYGAEILDETAYGDDTRSHRGGLLTAKVMGKGFAESGAGLSETVLFADNGTDDTVVAVFPNGVTEGVLPGAGDGFGYAMKGVQSEFQLGGGVGDLLPLAFTYEARGID